MENPSFYVRNVYKNWDLEVYVYEAGVEVNMIHKLPRHRTVSRGFEWGEIEADEAEIWADDNW